MNLLRTRTSFLCGVAVLLGFSVAPTSRAQSSYFAEVYLPALPPVRFGAVALGDYDQDGDFDLVLSGSRNHDEDPQPITRLYRNDGDDDLIIDNASGMPEEVTVIVLRNTVSIGNSAEEGVWQSAAAWGDYDRDGDLDLAVAGLTASGAPSTRIYEFGGGRDARLITSLSLPGVWSGDLDWGDYDNDGDLDLAVCGRDADDEPVLAIHENLVDQSGTFQLMSGVFPGVMDCTLEWGDYDVDGDMDLLVTGVTKPQAFVTRVLRNDGGSFTMTSSDLPGLLFASGAWGDYDADGDLDILLSGARLSPRIMEGRIEVLRNDDGRFTSANDLLHGAFENDVTLGRYRGAVGWGDFTNSGYLDFFITGAKNPTGTETLQLYRNMVSGTYFAKSGTERFNGGLFGGALWADYDSDLDLDLLVWGDAPGREPTIRMLRNETLYGRRRPISPTSLEAQIDGNSVTLSWTKGFDRQSPENTLTYNIRVGTTRRAVDVVSPMSDRATGQRYISRRGNIGLTTAWTLKGLEPGTYYWSVQALDNTYSASLFSEEHVFVIES